MYKYDVYYFKRCKVNFNFQTVSSLKVLLLHMQIFSKESVYVFIVIADLGIPGVGVIQKSVN